MSAGTDPTRRAVLAGGVLLLGGACTGAQSSTPRSLLSAQQRLARRTATDIRQLSDRYAATLAAHPSLRARLMPLAAEHDAHASALERLVPRPTATPSPRPSAPTRTVPSTAAEAITALAATEQVAATRRAREALKAAPELARLLASIAACEAVHAAVLAAQ